MVTVKEASYYKIWVKFVENGNGTETGRTSQKCLMKVITSLYSQCDASW